MKAKSCLSSWAEQLDGLLAPENVYCPPQYGDSWVVSDSEVSPILAGNLSPHYTVRTQAVKPIVIKPRRCYSNQEPVIYHSTPVGQSVSRPGLAHIRGENREPQPSPPPHQSPYSLGGDSQHSPQGYTVTPPPAKRLRTCTPELQSEPICKPSRIPVRKHAVVKTEAASQMATGNVKQENCTGTTLPESPVRPRNISCTKCTETFVSQVGFHKHYLVRHKEYKGKVTEFSCQLCDKTYKSMKQLRFHLIKEHSATHYPYMCRHCQQGFFRATHLEKHCGQCQHS